MIKRLIGLLAVSLVLAFAAIGHAQDICNAMTFDGANVFESDLEKVNAAGKKLLSLGVDLRVRTEKSLEGATVDDLEQRLESGCASWRNPSGGRKSNLLVLIAVVGPPKKAGLFYGSQWNASLGASSNVTRVLADFMAPRFRDDDWAGGIILGLNEIWRLVDLQVHPQAPGSTVIYTAPTDYSGLWLVLKIVMAFITVMVAMWVFSLILQRRMLRHVAQQKALLAKNSVASRITSLDSEVTRLGFSVDHFAEMFAEDELTSVRGMMSEMKTYYAASVSRYRDLEEAGCDPTRSGLSASEYGEITNNYSEVLHQLIAIEGAKGPLSEKVSALAKMKSTAEKAIEDALKALQEAQQRIKEIQEKGFKTSDADPLVDGAKSECANATALCGEKRFSAGLASATRSQNHSANAFKAVQQMLEFKTAADEKIGAFREQIEMTKQATKDGYVIAERMKKVYAAASYESVNGNVMEATNRINWSLQALETAIASVSMEEQEWVAADVSVQNIERWLGEAKSLMRSIMEREKNLKQAAADVPLGIIAAAEDIQEARDYILQYDDDIRDELEDDLDEADKALESVRQELNASTPDYPKALTLIQQAHEAADTILLEAKSEHEAADRLRVKAADAMRDAKRAISKADEYMSDHQSRVRMMAKEHLSDAKRWLAQAEEAPSLDGRISFARKAKESAEEAYQNIKDRVAESQRVSHRSSGGGGRTWGAYAPSYHDTTLIVVSNTETHHREVPSYAEATNAAEEWQPSDGGGSIDVSSDSGGGGSIDI